MTDAKHKAGAMKLAEAIKRAFLDEGLIALSSDQLVPLIDKYTGDELLEVLNRLRQAVIVINEKQHKGIKIRNRDWWDLHNAILTTISDMENQ